MGRGFGFLGVPANLAGIGPLKSAAVAVLPTELVAEGRRNGIGSSQRMASERDSRRTFFGLSALLFAASAAVTIVWSASMSAMGEMPMPGGWTMSMAWMRMPGQTWPGAAASFLGMWGVMMEPGRKSRASPVTESR